MADSSSDEPPSLQHPHIYRPVPRRAFAPQALQDAADSPTHSFSPPASSDLQSSRSSDFLAQLNARLLRTYNAREDAPESPVEGAATTTRLPRQNKSFLNMNSSTLFGIYDDVGASSHGAASVAETPWGTGAETPGHTGMAWSGGVYDGAGEEGGLSMAKSTQRGKATVTGTATATATATGTATVGKASARRRVGLDRRARSTPARYSVLAAKLVALFTFGVFYGTIVSHLHDTRQLAAVHVAGVDRQSWFYVATWGCAGVALGSLLPYVDLLWRRHASPSSSPSSPLSSSSSSSGAVSGGESAVNEKDDAEVPVSEQINDVVRSVAAFVGVAFAIRRLPWQSTLQLTLTLALVNPALWYILDRSKPGLSLSLLVTSLLTSLMFLLSNPTALPFPQTSGSGGNATTATTATSAVGGGGARGVSGGDELFAGVVSYEQIASVTWVGSVLFCSCVCFGSIGRRLGVLER